MSRPQLPEPVATVAAELGGLPGVTAVALGGSRANATHRPDSDWDLGVYYRGALDPGDVRRLGHSGYVSELGEWGPIMNGGAWLTVMETPIDVLFRDLDVVDRWRADAERGRFEVLVQNGYIVGAPTYVPVGELAIKPAAERWYGRGGRVADVRRAPRGGGRRHRLRRHAGRCRPVGCPRPAR